MFCIHFALVLVDILAVTFITWNIIPKCGQDYDHISKNMTAVRRLICLITGKFQGCHMSTSVTSLQK